ncbi:hypothetical protein GX48_03148 [Paracoccidioides brasiliensis]|nr:hypothetical protein GX48_03148 [Paracoccidioides brasiliensis]
MQDRTGGRGRRESGFGWRKGVRKIFRLARGGGVKERRQEEAGWEGLAMRECGRGVVTKRILKMEPDSAQMIDRAEEQLMTMEDDGGIWGAGEEEQGGRDSRDSWDSR